MFCSVLVGEVNVGELQTEMEGELNEYFMCCKGILQLLCTKTDRKTHYCVSSAGRQLLLKAVNRVWTELMHSKRQMLEDIFKVSLPCNDRGHVDIATARPALEEPALKSWQNHLGQ